MRHAPRRPTSLIRTSRLPPLSCRTILATGQSRRADSGCPRDGDTTLTSYLTAPPAGVAFSDEERAPVMRWNVWAERFARLRPSWKFTRRILPSLATILIVAALAVTFYGLAQAQRHTGASTTDPTTASSLATATSPAPTATATGSPLSPPPPTAQPGGHPVVPSNGSGPFKVVAVSVSDSCGIYGGMCSAHLGCPINPEPILGVIWMAKNAPAGDVTYRWIVSDGRVTAPQIAHFDGQSFGDGPIYDYQPEAAIADGRAVTFQLEILSPVQMISPPSVAWHIVCLPWIKGEYVYPTGATARFYDCATGGTQTFPYTASVDLAPSPSFTFSYYWKRSDGSVSATRQVTTTGGATSVTLQGDSISLTAPSPPPPIGPSPIGNATDTLVVLNPSNAINGSSASQYSVQGLPVYMPNCSDTAATPTPTP